MQTRCVDAVGWGEAETLPRRAGRASAVIWGVVGALVAGGLVLSGIFEVYVRELEPYSYAERRCGGDGVGETYSRCLQNRLDDGVLTPGVWCFASALVVTVVTVVLARRAARSGHR